MKHVITMNRELIMNLIDGFESFLESRGFTVDNFPNKDREGTEGEAIIYGRDCDDLETIVRDTLRAYGIITPQVFGEIKLDVIENGLSIVEVELI